MELFTTLSVLAALLFASASLISKHFLELQEKSYIVLGAVFGLPFFILYSVSGFLVSGIVVEPLMSVGSALAGIMYSIILVLYLKGLGAEEASKFIPTISLNTVFLAVLSVVFLDQVFTLQEYAGISLAVIGAVAISLENPFRSLTDLSSPKGLFLALLIAVLIAFRDLLLDFVTSGFDIWASLFWIGTGGLIFSIFVLVYSKDGENLSKILTREQGIVLSGTLRSIAFFLYLAAISVGSAAKASALIKLNGVFVFLGALILSKTVPEFLEEETGVGKLLQKFLASLIIFTGVILLL